MSNVGGADSTVGITLEQVRNGPRFDDMNYGERAVYEGFVEVVPLDQEVNKDFVSLRISQTNSTHIVVPLLAMLCNL